MTKEAPSARTRAALTNRLRVQVRHEMRWDGMRMRMRNIPNGSPSEQHATNKI